MIWPLNERMRTLVDGNATKVRCSELDPSKGGNSKLRPEFIAPRAKRILTVRDGMATKTPKFRKFALAECPPFLLIAV